MKHNKKFFPYFSNLIAFLSVIFIAFSPIANAQDESIGMLGCKHQYWADYYNKLSEALRLPYVAADCSLYDEYHNLPPCLGYPSASVYKIIYGSDGNWESGLLDKGKSNRLFFHKTGSGLYVNSSAWGIGEPIWQDGSDGKNGVYDSDDILVYPGSGTYVLKDGDLGISALSNIFYNDTNNNNKYDADEEVWADSHYSFVFSLPYNLDLLRKAIYYLLEARYIHSDIADDFTGRENEIPFLLEYDSEGNPTAQSVKFFPEKGENAHLFTLLPGELEDGTPVNGGQAIYGKSLSDPLLGGQRSELLVFPIHFEEIRRVLNMNLFKWFRTTGKWTNNGEKNYSYAYGCLGASLEDAYSKAVEKFQQNAISSPFDENWWPEAFVQAGHFSSLVYLCEIVRKYGYLEVKLDKSIPCKYSADFYIKGRWNSRDDYRFHENGDPVLYCVYNRFAQEPETDKKSLSKKFGSLTPPAFDFKDGLYGYFLSDALVVLKFDGPNGFPDIDIQEPAPFSAAFVPDTDTDGLVDIGVDIDNIRTETGTFFHRPESKEPIMILPLSLLTRADSNSPAIWEYITQGDLSSRLNWNSQYTNPVIPNNKFNAGYQTLSTDSFMFRDIRWDDDELDIHINRIGIVRPRGNIVIFDFPYDSSTGKFSDIGVPVGINKNRTYRLIHQPEGVLTYFSDRGEEYGLCFESGFTHLFLHRGNTKNYEAMGVLSRINIITRNKRFLAFIPPYTSAPENLKKTLKSDVNFEWDSGGLLSKITCKTKDGTKNIVTSIERDEKGKIIALKKQVPPELAINGKTEYEIRIDGNTITYPDGSTSTRSQTASAGNPRTVTITRNVPDSGSIKTEYTYNSSDLLTEQKITANADAKTTSYTYYTGEDIYPNTTKKKHKLKSVTYPDGSWTYYEYNDNGWISKECRPLKDAPSTPGTGGREIEYLYESHEVGDIVSDRILSQPPRTITEKIADVVVTKNLFSYVSNPFSMSWYIPSWWWYVTEKSQECVGADSPWNDPCNLKNETKYIIKDMFSVRYPAYIQSPLEKTTFSYVFEGIDVPSYPVEFCSNIQPNTTKTNVKKTATAQSVDGVGLQKIETITNPRGIVYSYKVTDSESGQVIQLVESQTDSFGRITRTDYLDGSHEEFNNYCLFGPQEIIDRNGGASTLLYGPDGLVKSISTPLAVTEYSYDALGNVSDMTVTPAAGVEGEVVTESYKYDALSRITSKTDHIGTTSYVYSGTSVTTTYPDGTSILTDRYLDGTTASVSGSAAYPVSYDYGVDSGKGQWTRSDAGGIWSKSYRNMLGQVYRLENSAGYWSETEFDSKGRPISTSDSSNRTYLNNYNNKNEISQTTENGLVTDYAYSVTDGKHLHTSTMHSDLGDIVTVDETTLDGLTSSNTVNGRTTASVMERLGAGMIKTVTTDHLGRVTENIVSPAFSKTELRSGGTAIASVQNDLDGHSRVKDSVFSRTGTDFITYRAGTSQIQQYTASDGKNTTLTYQSGNYNPVSVKTPDNSILTTQFNTRGQFEGFGGAADGVFDAFTYYDDQGRPNLLKTTGAPGTADTTWNYSAATGLVEGKQIQGVPSYNIDYYPDGRLKTLSKNGIGTKTFNYTAAPQLFPAGFSYSDGVTPDVIISGHNDFGQPGQITTNGVSEHTFTYNNDTQITNINLTSSLMPSASSAYTYDSNLRRLTFDLRLSDSSALARYSYDTAGRLKTVSSGDIEAVYEYVPNAVNLIDTITIKKGGNTVLVRDFDYAGNSNRITSVSNQRPVGSDNYSYEYHPNTDKISKVTLTDGTVLEYQYDARGQLFGALCKRGALVSSEYAYTSDSITNVLEGGRVRFGGVPEFETQPDIFNSIEMRRVGDTVEISGSVKKEAAISVNNELLERYDSEEFFAILNANNAGSAVFMPINVTAALFDPEAVPEIGGNQPGNVAGADLIATVSGTVYMPQNPETPVYDNIAGHLKEDSEKICAWDFENRLLSVESKIVNAEGKKVKVENVYDYRGRRILKKIYENGALAQTHDFYYDQVLLDGSPADFGVLVAETVKNNSGTVIADWKYIQGLDINGVYQGLGGVGSLCAATDSVSGRTLLPSMDAKGTICAWIDASNGNKVAETQYDPYGRVMSRTGDKNIPSFGFNGKYYDNEFGIYNFGLRYLQSETCKWLSRDPIQEAGGLNQYAYGNGDPINGIEYLGCEWYNNWEDFKSASRRSFGLGMGLFWTTDLGQDFMSLEQRRENLITNVTSDVRTIKKFHNEKIFPVTSYLPVKAVDIGYGIPSDISFGYDVWEKGTRGRATLWEFDRSRQVWNLPTAMDNNTTAITNRIFINGILNNEARSGWIGQSHTNTLGTRDPFILLHNPTYGFWADLTECTLGKFYGPSNTAKQMAALLAKRARINQPTELVMHSQGTLIGTNALKILSEDYGITNWSGLTAEYHGSAENILIARKYVAEVGGQWGGMENHPGDLVGNVIGFNTLSPWRCFYSTIRIPTLFMDTEGFWRSPHTIYYNQPLP